MAVLTAKGISEVALALLQRSLVLPRTVTMVPGNEFIGPNGGTITVRVPQPGAALTQSSPGAALTPADVTEIPVDVTLAHVYHLKNITDQELNYSLEDFARQVTRVQVQAVARGAEQKLLDVMNAITPDGTIQFANTGSDADTKATMLAIREYLTKNECPAEDRYMAASPEVVTRLLSCSDFVRMDAVGTPDAIRSGVVGRIYGMTVVEVYGLDAGTAVAYHRSGFAMAVRQPENPRGATESFGISADGLALRQVFQYAAGTAQDQSLVSTFAGAARVAEDGTGTNGTVFDRSICVQIDPTP